MHSIILKQLTAQKKQQKPMIKHNNPDSEVNSIHIIIHFAEQLSENKIK